MAQISYYLSEGALVRREGVAMSEVWDAHGGWRAFSVDTGTATSLTAAQAKQQFPDAFAARRAPVRAV